MKYESCKGFSEYRSKFQTCTLSKNSILISLSYIFLIKVRYYTDPDPILFQSLRKPEESFTPYNSTLEKVNSFKLGP